MNILFMLLLAVSLYAETHTSGKIQYNFSSISTDCKSFEEDEISQTLLQFNLDYNYKDIYIQITPMVNIFHTQNKFIQPNYYNTWDESELFLRSFYISYTDNEITFGVGLLPFSDSDTIKYNNNYTSNGEGIYMLNDNNLASVFLLWKHNNNRLITGIGTVDSLLPNGTYIADELKENSYTAFIIDTYTYNKFKFTNEFLYNSIYFEGVHTGDAYLLGSTIEYNDSEVSGVSIYTTIGASMYKNNSINAKQEIYKRFGIPEGTELLYPDSFAINDDTYYGQALLIGFRKDFDIFSEEFYINAEYFHTFNDWSSGNQGNVYSGKATQTFNIRDNSYYINAGYNYNRNLQIKLIYQYIELEESSRIGAPMTTTPNKNYIIPIDLTYTDILSINFSYRF